MSEHVFAFVSAAAASMVSAVILSNGRALLVDPGVLASEVDAIDRFVAGRGAAVEALLLTHHHWDHVLATRRWPEAGRIAHPKLEGIVLEQQASPDYREMLRVAFAEHGEDAPVVCGLLPVTQPVEDGSQVQLGELCARVLHLPGHAPDAIGLLIEPDRLLLSADMLAPSELPMPDEDLVRYLDSLERVDRLVSGGAVTRVIPGHGWPLERVEDVLTQLTRDRHYLRELQRTAAELTGTGFDSAWPAFASLDYPGKGTPARDAEHLGNVRRLLQGA